MVAGSDGDPLPVEDGTDIVGVDVADEEREEARLVLGLSCIRVRPLFRLFRGVGRPCIARIQRQFVESASVEGRDRVYRDTPADRVRDRRRVR